MQAMLAIHACIAFCTFCSELCILNMSGEKKMEFQERIRDIRKQSGLSQEQFAEKLNVTRQAVSNWERGVNLPDIGMLIRISDAFDISLDTLVKGEKMTRKIIHDGSDTIRARYHMISAMIGVFLLISGIGCFVIRACSVEYIDEAGFLHENFFLVPIGYLLILAGILCMISVALLRFMHRRAVS